MNHGRTDSTGPGRPAELKADFSSVVSIVSSLAVPHGTQDQQDSSYNVKRFKDTRNTSARDHASSPDGKLMLSPSNGSAA